MSDQTPGSDVGAQLEQSTVSLEAVDRQLTQQQQTKHALLDELLDKLFPDIRERNVMFDASVRAALVARTCYTEKAIRGALLNATSTILKDPPLDEGIEAAFRGALASMLALWSSSQSISTYIVLVVLV